VEWNLSWRNYGRHLIRTGQPPKPHVHHSSVHENAGAAELRKLTSPELVKVGHMNPERWRSIGEAYAMPGMIRVGFDLSQFLYDPVKTPKDLTMLYQVLIVVMTLLVVASAIAVHN
jgi:hypothetical protein